MQFKSVDIKESLHSYGVSVQDNSVLQQCINICNKYQLSPLTLMELLCAKLEGSIIHTDDIENIKNHIHDMYIKNKKNYENKQNIVSQKKIKHNPSTAYKKDNIKNDSNKLCFNLVPEICIEEVVKVFMFGAKKYGDFNWMQKPGFHYSRLYNSLRRHLSRWKQGFNKDEETKELEMAHVACNAFMLLYYQKLNIGIDDRIHVKNNINSE